MKKFLSFILALVLCVGSATPAFASDTSAYSLIDENIACALGREKGGNDGTE